MPDVYKTIPKSREKYEMAAVSACSDSHAAIVLLMGESRLFGYHIPMIIKSKCFEMKAYPVHDCWLDHR